LGNRGGFAGARSLAHFLSDGLAGPMLLGQAGGGGGGFESLFSGMAIPLMVTLVLMYLLLMRPEQKKRKEMERVLSAIKKNDHVVTIGGIFGTVVLANAGSDSVVIRVDDTTGTKLKVLRSAISRVGGEGAAEGEAKIGE